MTIRNFLKLVEIQTKLASLFPFLIGVLFSLSYFKQINWLNTLIFFCGMLVFDMATTAINNYMDFIKAKDDIYKSNTNIIGQANLDTKRVAFLISMMLIFSMVVGLVLVYRTGWLMLVMGGVCCFIGIFYTYGPIPLSRMPLGELFSGVTMGLGIFLMTVYINTYSTMFLYLDLSNWEFQLVGNIKILLAILWASLPMVFTIANIMLANNLCDLDEDIKNHRYTLPYYIGRERGVVLFRVLMFSCYGIVIIGLLVGVYQWPMLITLLTFPIIKKNVSEFSRCQIKSKTFVISIKNLVVFNVAQIIGLLISLIV